MVAVKVQRPDIRERVLEDLEVLEDIAGFLDQHTQSGQQVDFIGMVAQFRQSLLRELDYRQEAQHLLAIGDALRDFDAIVVPRPVEDYTTSRILTMDYVRGTKITTLSPVVRLEMQGQRMAEQLFRAYLRQILIDGLFHADPHPGNILLLDDGRPLLLDFGAARRVIGDATQALTAFLKPGYAPVEQYAEMPSMKQGPWTDLYALGSVVHYAITGHTPPESVARLIKDTMVPLASAAAGRYSARFLRAIDHALAVRPDDRPHSAAEMRSEIGVEERRSRASKAGAIPTVPGPLQDVPAAAEELTVPPRQSPPLKPLPRLEPPPLLRPQSPPQRAAQAAPPLAVPQPARRAAGWLLAGALALTTTAGLGWWWLSEPDAAVAPQAKTPSRVPEPAAAAVSGERSAAPGSTPADAAMPSQATLDAVKPEASPPLSVPPAPLAGAAADEPAARDKPAAAAAVSARPIPKKNSPNPRCTEIIARVSLGEELSAQDQALLKGECRK